MYITSLLWAFYLGFAPVYWIPFLSVQHWSYVKTSALVIAIAFTWLLALRKGKVNLPKGIHGVVGLIIILLLSVPAIYQADLTLAIRKTISILYGFAALWSFYVYWRISKHPELTLVLASIIISILCALTISSYFIGFPDWSSPSIFLNAPIHISGFGGLRTGWSNALSLYVGLVFFILIGREPSTLKTTLCFLIVLFIVGGQIVVAGRAGILASFFAIAFISWFYLPKKFALAVFVIGFLAGSYFITDELTTHLRVDRLEGADISDTRSLDHFSAGRISSYKFAIEKWFESPIIGHGYGEVHIGGTSEIHNMWLRILAEGGIIFFGGFAYFCFRLVKNTPLSSVLTKKIGRKIGKYNRSDYILWSVLIQGLIITMFEPNFVLGTFQTSAIWWVVSGAYIAQLQLYTRIIKHA